MHLKATQEEAEKIQVSCSLMNFFDIRFPQVVFWTADKFVRIAYASGYTGLEWHPIRRTVAGLQMQYGLVNQHTKDAIQSMHQSWRQEENKTGFWQALSRFPTFASLFLFPDAIDSIDTLYRLEKILNKKLPIVLYPSLQTETTINQKKFTEKIFQPTSLVMKRWDITTPKELTEKMLQKGYDGFALDLFHFRAEPMEGIQLEDWHKTLPFILPYTKELHVSAGRIDISQHVIDTLQELKDLLQGKGEIFSMLKEIGKYNIKNLRVVTEIPAIALYKIREKQEMFLSKKDFITYHTRIVEQIQIALSS